MAANALTALRGEMLAAAERFADYNFRSYFVQHTKDTLDRVAAQDDAAVQAFVDGEGKAKLAQMHRMAAVNAMYGDLPVVIDTNKPSA